MLLMKGNEAMSEDRQERQETRAEEVARVHSYLASQSMRRTPAQLAQVLQEAHQQFLAALNTVPEALSRTVPREGEWSALDVLMHMRTMAAFDLAAISTVLEHGTQPANIQDTITPAPPDATRPMLLADLEHSRTQLIALVLQAAPEAHLDITWGHSEFGAMHWREWLLFARIHTLDHAHQMESIAAALAQQGGTAHETSH